MIVKTRNNIIKLIVLITMIGVMSIKCEPVRAKGTASWYSRHSVLKEGNSGITASGEVFDDKAYTCAVWGEKFGETLEVTNLTNGLSVKVRVTDRGPAKRLVKKGRIIDLSKRAFAEIADLKQGVIPVRVEIIR